jgi:hypothetical protein
VSVAFVVVVSFDSLQREELAAHHDIVGSAVERDPGQQRAGARVVEPALGEEGLPVWSVRAVRDVGVCTKRDSLQEKRVPPRLARLPARGWVVLLEDEAAERLRRVVAGMFLSCCGLKNK